MNVRSRTLAVLGASMLASAGALAALLVHDGEVDARGLLGTSSGDAVSLKGRPLPFHPDDLGAWAPWRDQLAGHLYVIEPEDHVMVLLSSAEPLPGHVIVLEGDVLGRGAPPHAEHDELLVVHVRSWREPLVFD